MALLACNGLAAGRAGGAIRAQSAEAAPNKATADTDTKLEEGNHDFMSEGNQNSETRKRRDADGR